MELEMLMLTDSNGGDLEVIIIDNGAQEDVDPMVNLSAGSLDSNIEYVFEDVTRYESTICYWIFMFDHGADGLDSGYIIFT
jgi:hypothetical protein